MATGASTAQLAILLIDASKGLLCQTHRHSFIVSMFGVRHIVLAINKMDLVGYEQAHFNEIVDAFQRISTSLGFHSVQPIPLSALTGDNISAQSDHMPWYRGPTLLHYLEQVSTDDTYSNEAFCMPIQWVNYSKQNFRGFCGRIIAGKLCPGDVVKVLPRGQKVTIDRIVSYDGDLDQAIAGQSVTCTLAHQVDVSRGDVLVAFNHPSKVASQFAVDLLWLSEQKMIPGRHYFIKIGTLTATCILTTLNYRIEMNTLEPIAAKVLSLNDIGQGILSVDRDIPYEPYENTPELGGFILIDKINNETLAAGLIRRAVTHAPSLHQQSLLVNRALRAQIKAQKPFVCWLTGLSGAGKSTIANLVEQRLNHLGKHTMLLDGDNIRSGLNRDLHFTDEDRVENIRRIAEVTRLMIDAGLIVLVSFISPFAADRAMARDIIGAQEFAECFIDAPLAIVEARDVKGLYKKARAGEIKQFTGIDSPYEPPIKPDVHLDTALLKPEAAADQVMDFLRLKGMI